MKEGTRDEEIQSATAITTAEYNKLKKKADRLNELLVIYKRHYGNVIEYALELLRKANLWDQYAIYDNDNEPDILVKDLIIAYEKIEAVKEFVLSRRDDIEKDIEDFGMLKPVLNYFLAEA